MYLIQKDVPIPHRSGYVGAAPKYPFRSMEIGDSFLIPTDDPRFFAGTKGARCHPVQNSMHHYKKEGLWFASRMMEDGSCRVWRIA